MATAAHNNTSNLELLAIYEVSKILGSSLDLQQTLREVLRLLAYQLQMRRGRIWLLADDNALHLVAAVGLSREEIERTHLQQAGEGITGRILKTGMPTVVPNLAEEPLFLNRSAGRDDLDEEVTSLVGVPIKAAGKVIGVLTIDRLSDDGPATHFGTDVRFLTMVANLIGQTVRLHRTVAEERHYMMRATFRMQKELGGARLPIPDVVCTSPNMQEVLAQVHRVAPFKSTVMIRGESGTGKELIARAIHQLSPRKDGAFIRVNCAALPETLLESELFGYERGAFTGANRDHKGRFELASGGTLFLDEIGDISASFQAKLLRVLQEQEFERVGGTRTLKTDVRLIAATNVNLEEAVGLGKFRADLYFRINVVSLFLPPLRERRRDIPLLARHFVEKFNRENGMALALTDEALEVLTRCPWPGNVRELENCIERTATQCRDGLIRDADLACHMNLCNSSALLQYRAFGPPGSAASGCPATPCAGSACRGAVPTPAAPAVPAAPPSPTAVEPVPVGAGGDEAEPAGQRERLIWAMDRSGWVQAKAARLLGMSTRQIGYALRKYNIAIKRL